MTKFGISQLKNKTPNWISLIFGIIIVFTTAATFLIASTALIPNATKVELGVYIKTFEIIVFGISKLFGISSQEEIKEILENNEK